MSDGEFVIGEDSPSIGDRLDRYLTGVCPDVSRSKLQSWIKDGHVTVNGAACKPKNLVLAGDRIFVSVPAIIDAGLRPQDLPLIIIHEDEDILVLNKAHGMVVHPAAGNADGTLVNALLYHCEGKLSSLGGEDRPGIVHRLDKDTSGCMVVAKTDAAYASLTAQFAGRETSKTYLALVEGRPPMDFGRLENNIGRHPRDRQKMAVVFPPAGKTAITEYEVIHSGEDASLVKCCIFTGRTHQIRVHMRELGHPIAGDPIYANVSRQGVKVTRLMLHAWKLGFRHPVSGENVDFEATIPDEYAPWLANADLG